MNQKQIVFSDKSMRPTGPYSPAVVYQSLVFVAGQTAIDPQTNKLVDGGIEAETHQVLKNLKEVLEAAGSSLEKVLKTTCFLADINDFDKVNAIYSEFFHADPPARTCLQVTAMPKGARIEIEAIAYK